MPEVDADLNAAISSAVTEAHTEVTGEAPVIKDAPTPEPEKTPEKPAEVKPSVEVKPEPEAKPEPDEDEVFTPTAEELAIIDKNPELKKVYRSMQKGLTQKTQKLAEIRKQNEEKTKLADWIQGDPDNAVRAIAASRGITLTEAKVEAETKVVDALETQWTDTVGAEAAALLRPLFEQTAKAMLEQTIGPLKQQTEELQKAAAVRGIAASTREFGASVVERGEEWDEDIQKEMAELSETVQPGDETLINDYLATLYDTVSARRMRTKNARANLERLRRVRNEQEPTSSVRPVPKGAERVTVDMSEKDAVALASRLAMDELGIRR